MGEQQGFSDTDSGAPLPDFTGTTELPLTTEGLIEQEGLNPTQVAAIEAGPGWLETPAHQEEFANPVEISIVDPRYVSNFHRFFEPDPPSMEFSTTYIGGEPANIPPDGGEPFSAAGADFRRMKSEAYQRFAIINPDFCHHVLEVEARMAQKRAEGDADWIFDNEEEYDRVIFAAYQAMSKLIDLDDPAVETNMSGTDTSYDNRFLLR